MKCLDNILLEEMQADNNEEIFHMDNSCVDNFYPEEDEEYCNAILKDDEDYMLIKNAMMETED